MTDSNEQVASEISQRIQQLSSMLPDQLKMEMQALKKAIMDNPAACLLLKEEDIGIMVSSLRKMTGLAITQATEKKTRAATPKTNKKLSAAELAAALDDEDF